ncbi:major facilitator superfamily transporter [Metarhizium robertsii ARSEF 23]|uniref:Major facilitator superfamily transporter n=1 Tax=Metarhizium robertsii (strain ARSEF 23 / ATCC MYA-3075) TaxID=655844 RepID=A0A0B2XE53_METRA|nr:major facilitator superfamily transporter [Metarhizium robertsii ARSEF 23]KHO11015.1 major facilitator superfamily transporter [Metarhizium robertsii ARSEF 23]
MLYLCMVSTTGTRSGGGRLMSNQDVLARNLISICSSHWDRTFGSSRSHGLGLVALPAITNGRALYMWQSTWAVWEQHNSCATQPVGCNRLVVVPWPHERWQPPSYPAPNQIPGTRFGTSERDHACQDELLNPNQSVAESS